MSRNTLAAKSTLFEIPDLEGATVDAFAHLKRAPDSGELIR